MSDNVVSTYQKTQSSTGLTFESRNLEAMATAKILAHDISERLYLGSVAIVADRPVAMLSAVRKQWLQLVRQIRRDHVSRHNHEAIQKLVLLQHATFTADDPLDEPMATVSFATTAQFLAAPPTCPTLLVVSCVKKHELYMLSSWMPHGSKVIIYD